MTGDEFVNQFNSYYPFEQYIMQTPKQINSLFDDVLLTELFIPDTEIKPITHEGKFYGEFTKVNWQEVYLKLQCKGVEFRMSFYDFDENIQEEIGWAVIQDFDPYSWDCLYIEFDDDTLEMLKQSLQIQYDSIKAKYGECKVKEYFKMTETLNLLKEICG